MQPRLGGAAAAVAVRDAGEGATTQSGPWPAPAKLNLMLRILGRRPDGYHSLQTVFQFIDFCDRLWFRTRRDGLVERGNAVAGLDAETDLTVRAAVLLKRMTGTPLGVDIRVEKNLPMGAGIGGGSSDAATTLVALNRLWGLNLSGAALADLGRQLGADVPVFIRGRAAWAEGVGEELMPVDLVEPWYVLVIPPCHVSTAAVFRDPELTRNSPPIKIHDFLNGDRTNDCLPVVRARYPSVAQAYDWLSRYGRPQLTGTGACVFAAFEGEGAARGVLGELPRCFQGVVTRGLNRSPLLQAVEAT